MCVRLLQVQSPRQHSKTELSRQEPHLRSDYCRLLTLSRSSTTLSYCAFGEKIQHPLCQRWLKGGDAASTQRVPHILPLLPWKSLQFCSALYQRMKKEQPLMIGAAPITCLRSKELYIEGGDFWEVPVLSIRS